MNATKLFFGGIVFFISGVALIVHTYSNVLPEISASAVSTTPIQKVDTIFIKDTAQHTTEHFLCSVYFTPGSSFISDKERRKLDNSLSMLSKNDASKFRIDGFADPTGNGSVNNDWIALNRAFSLCSFLQKRGIAKDNLLMRSFGAPQNDHSVIDSLRKVDITVIGGVH